MATVGFATLQIIPSMRNISGAISGSLGNLAAIGQRAGNQIGSGMASGIDAKRAAVDKAAASVAKARDKELDAAGKVRVAEEQLQELRDRGISSGSRFTAAQERLAAAQRRSSSATDAARSAYQDLQQAQTRLANHTDEAETETRSFSGALGDAAEGATSAASNIGKLAVAAAGIGSAMEVATSAMDFEAVTAKMNASLGATGPLAEEYGRTAGELYSNGMGDSMEDVSAAIEATATSFVTLGSEGEVSLEKATTNAMNFAKVFDVDVTEAVQSASQLVSNGLAADSTTAFDMMTTAFQRVPAAMRDELPEILNEYGTNFRALGFDGQSSFNMLISAAGQGKFALDKTGDALKEFTIRGSDMSKASSEAYAAIGLDAEKMSNAVAAGGAGAQSALQQTAQGLLKIKDPAERANAAIALFGTPLEDLSVDQIPKFLQSMAGGENAMAGFEGSTDKMGQTLGDTAQNKLTTFTRGLQQGVIDTLGKTVGFLTDNAGLLRDLGVAAGVTGGILALMAGPQLVTMIKNVVTSTRAWTVVQGILNTVMTANPLVRIAMLIGLLVGAIVIAYRNSETFRNVVQGAWEGIKKAVGAVWSWLSTTVFPPLMAVFRKIGEIALWLWQNVMLPAWNGIKAAIGLWWTGVKVYFAAVMSVFRAIGAVALWLWRNVMLPAWNGIKAAIGVAWSVISVVIEGIKAGFRLVATVALWLWQNVIVPAWAGIQQAIEVAKTIISAVMDGIKAAFQAVADKAGEVKDWIVDKWNSVVSFFTGLKDKIGNAAKGMWDGLKEGARSVFNWVANMWNNTMGRLKFEVPSWVPGMGGKSWSVPEIPLLASGGIAGVRNGLLHGPGTGTSDSILGVDQWGMPTAAVSAGEFIVNAKATARWLPLLQAINGGGANGKSINGMQALAGGGLVAGAKLPPWDGEGGMKPIAVLVRRLIHGLWPEVSTIGGYRPSDPFPDHPSGQALDIMISDLGLGNAVKQWLMDNKQLFDLNYTIWQQKYEPASGGGNIMEDRGSPTQNHMDHIHSLFGQIGSPPQVNPDIVPTGLKYPAGKEPAAPVAPAAPTTDPTVDPAAPTTTDTTGTTGTEKEKPKRMKSFRELGSDAGGLLADGIVDFFGIPSWIADPASAIKVDNGDSVRTDVETGTTGKTATVDPKQLRAAQDKVSTKTDDLKAARIALDEIEKDPKAKGSAKVTARNKVTKLERELATAKADLSDLEKKSPTKTADPAQAPAAPRNPDAKDYPGWIAKAAKDLGLPEKAAVIGEITALTEVGDPMKMYANTAVPESLKFPHDAVGSDYDSVGLFQQRDNGAWGTVAQRMSAYESAKLFYGAMTKVDGWQSMPEGDVAQATQRSAFPDRYAQHLERGRSLVKRTGLYDTGGWLNPGDIAVNKLRRPEPVLHPDHWDAVVDQNAAVRELVGAGIGGGGNTTNITVYGNTAGDIADEWERRQWRGSRGRDSRSH